MIRKTAMILAIAVLAAGTASAENIKNRLGLWMGIDTFKMQELNDVIGELSARILGQEAKPIKAMGGIGLEGGLGISENVMLGVRVGGYKSQVASASLDVPPIGSAKVSSFASAVPVMAGFRYLIPIDEKLWAGFGAFGGVARVIGNITVESDVLGVKNTTKMDYAGNAPAVEAILCFDYRISESISLGGDLGYMGMKANSIGAVKDYDFDGDGVVDVKKGTKAQNSAGKDAAMDLSGLTISLGLNLLF